MFLLSLLQILTMMRSIVIDQDVLLPAISYEKMHHRLLHANVEKVIKACRNTDIPINETKAREYHCK